MKAPVFFASPRGFRTWLQRYAGSLTELVVGFYKLSTGRPSITWPEAVDEALGVGWIDGVRKRIDEHRYQIRFTPRKPVSIWSAVNIARVDVLIGEGRMQSAGLAAFARRSEAKSRTYSYEQAAIAALAPDEEKAFRRRKAAWAFFERQAPGYRKIVLWWIVTARQPATRQRRLAKLIDASDLGKRL